MFALVNKFADWMRINHHEIKWARDITPSHLQEFADANKENWHGRTCQEMESRIHKLGKMVSTVYGIEVDYTLVKVSKVQKRQDKSLFKPMKREDFNKLNHTILSKKSGARYLPDIASRIGTRSEETRSIRAQDIDIEKRRVHILNGKNGKKRDVPIRDKDLDFFRHLKKKMEDENWLNACNGISEKSCNHMIRKCMRECGISESYKQSIHAIRKMYAVERMEEEKARGLNWRDSWCVVQRELGHGSRFRMDLASIYLGLENKDN